MNILYIEHYAGSPDMGMEFRPYYFAREWITMGHKVSIIAGDYSHLRKKNPQISRDMERTVIDGIDYYWLKTGTYEGNGVNRALTMIRFCKKLIRWKNWIKDQINPDVVISSSTYPIDSIPAHRICRIRGKKSLHIHEVHDMWPSTLTEIGGMTKRNPFVMLMQYGENYAYRYADTVVSLLPNAEEYMTEHGLERGKFHYIPNGIISDEWNEPEPLPEEHKAVLEQLKAVNKFIVGYFGGHALSNCLMPLIQSAEQIQDEKTHFVLVGEGTEKKALAQYTYEHGINHVTFLPPIDKKAIPTLTEYFDCIYIGAKHSPLYRFGICMNKMFDGMMAGKPLIFAVDAPKTPVEECGCGIMVSPENPAEIIRAIRELEDMPASDRERMAERGRREAMDNYAYEKLALDFLDVMEPAQRL